MNPFEDLIARATSSVPGLEANEALWNLRDDLEAEYGSAVLYEVVISASTPWPDFLAQVMPRITEHFEAKGLTMLGGPAAAVSVWRADRLYLFESRNFFGAIQAIEQLDQDGLWVRIGEWRQAAGLSVPREATLGKKRLVIPAERALMVPSSGGDGPAPPGDGGRSSPTPGGPADTGAEASHPPMPGDSSGPTQPL